METIGNRFVKGGLFIVIFSWFGYTLYWFSRSVLSKILTFSPQPISLYSIIFAESWGTVGLILRTAAGLAAIMVLISLLRGRESSRLLKLINFALLLEAAYFLTFLPAAIYPGLIGLFNIKMTYVSSETTLWLLFETGIPCLVEATLLPAALLKLRSKINRKSYEEAVKWSCIVGTSYLLMWWLNYSGQWFALFVQPEGIFTVYAGHGLSYVLGYPLNMFSFLLTFIGLLFLTIFFALFSIHTIRDPARILDLKIVGATLTALGGYFILNVLLHLIFKPFMGEYSIWNAFFMAHNVDLWCVTLPALGVPLMLGPHTRAKQQVA